MRSSGSGKATRPRILVDTNVWRYIADAGALEVVNRAARDGNGRILACPAVLYESLRLKDASLRHRLVKAICRSRWSRLTGLDNNNVRLLAAIQHATGKRSETAIAARLFMAKSSHSTGG